MKKVGEPAFTLTTQDRHGVLIKNNKTSLIGTTNGHQSGEVYSTEGNVVTLSACDYKSPKRVLIKNANKKGYTEAHNGDGVDLAYPNSETRRGRVQPQRSNALTTSDNLGVVLDDGDEVYIRKLTPRECWRLQGFTDEQFDKAQAVNSNTQLYKQAGNAVTVNVTYEIGKHIMWILKGRINGDFKSE